MYKKGQAALEFLTTYGWAFLVILVMIGALAYFGVLNPSRFVPETCTLGAAFLCDDAVIDTGRVTIKMRNNLEAINITNVTITDIDSGSIGANDTEIQLAAGGIIILTVAKPSGATWTVGLKKKVSADIEYFIVSSTRTFTKSTGGDIVGTIQ
ncbi:MAG: hypothetical protein H8D38_05485 [DPANN group archaeon]|nr:hypothetical protein [DPANN group archaeon]